MRDSIGIAGIGRMGQAIARRLQQTGAKVILLPPRTTPLPDDLAALPHAPDAAALAARSTVLITCLRDSGEVEELLPDMLAAAQGPLLFIDHTSGDPRRSRDHAARLRTAGHAHVDAALSGTPELATEGRLRLLAGGDAADVARLETLSLPYAGGGVIHAGGSGQGHLLRLVGGMMGFGIAALSAELLTIADRLGLDRDLVHTMITGTGADSRTFQAIHAVARDGAASGKARQLPASAAARDLAALDALLPTDAPSRAMLAATRHLLDRAEPGRLISDLHACLSRRSPTA